MKLDIADKVLICTGILGLIAILSPFVFFFAEVYPHRQICKEPPYKTTCENSTGLTQGKNLTITPSTIEPDFTEVQLYSKGKLLGNLCKDGKPGKVDLVTFCSEYKDVVNSKNEITYSPK